MCLCHRQVPDMFKTPKNVSFLTRKLPNLLQLPKLHKVAAMTSTVTRTTTRVITQDTKPSSPSTPFISPPPALTAKAVPLADSPTLAKCLTTLSSAFSVVPCTNAFAAESNQTVHAYVTKSIIESIQSHGGVLLQAGDASAVALWEVPLPVQPYAVPETPSTIGSTSSSRAGTSTHGYTNPDGITPSSGNLSIKQEWKNLVRAAKMKHIGVVESTVTPTESPRGMVIKPHYHLDFLARNPEVYPKIPGAISAVVRPYLALAKQESRSVWLEATSLDVVPLYEYFGFQVVDEILVGKGKVDRKGGVKEGGEGVQAWLMVIDNSLTT